ncbi:hypothetical protein DB30_02343 [Enhygromyxa salina]|uniref:Uncharacterized protein n=1 Tax=Enhygromyxa salina TaxID=215803 RepID=A0A0C2D8G7_9BACT|nr:hypothetical protein [Enhygromyxa salina]KIG17915.1 hypothetical protein DB30_02343 [Enhygromyxa salina]
MNLPWTLAWTLHLGAALFALNLAVGLSAQVFGAKFGAAHHWLYGVVFTGAIAAAVLAFHPALLLTILALACMPLTKPGGAAHPAVAVAGALGYVGAYLI